jgi:hypothetical protein
MRFTCKNPDCGRQFVPQRAGGRYCSVRCRVAAHRKSRRLVPGTHWYGKTPRLAAISRTLNGDGTSALPRAELAEKLLELAREADGGEPKTGRRYYYLALSHGYLAPDMGDSEAAKKSRQAAYKAVSDVLGVLRMEGRLPWRMVLDLTRELDEPLIYDSPRDARQHLRSIYNEDRWHGQPFYPIVIVEKDTLEPIVKPHARHWSMPFASSRGYSSLTLQRDTARMLRDRHARTGQPAKVYFLSDHDPSGFDLQRAWRDALDNFNVPFDRIERLGLNMAQITDPALDIERLAIGVKPSDSRSKAYVREYGNRCWEADILAADVITAAIDRAIARWLDVETWQQRAAEIDMTRKLL